MISGQQPATGQGRLRALPASRRCGSLLDQSFQVPLQLVPPAPDYQGTTRSVTGKRHTSTMHPTQAARARVKIPQPRQQHRVLVDNADYPSILSRQGGPTRQGSGGPPGRRCADTAETSPTTNARQPVHRAHDTVRPTVRDESSRRRGRGAATPRPEEQPRRTPKSGGSACRSGVPGGPSRHRRNRVS